MFGLKKLRSVFNEYQNAAEICRKCGLYWLINEIVNNRLTPNDSYMGRTAPLTSKRCILYIYSTNIGTEYFKHAL